MATPQPLDLADNLTALQAIVHDVRWDANGPTGVCFTAAAFDMPEAHIFGEMLWDAYGIAYAFEAGHA